MGKKKVVNTVVEELPVVEYKAVEPERVVLDMPDIDFSEVEFKSKLGADFEFKFKLQKYIPSYAEGYILDYCFDQYKSEIEKGANNFIAQNKTMVAYDMMVIELLTNIDFDPENYDILKYHGFFDFLQSQVENYLDLKYDLGGYLQEMRNPIYMLADVGKELVKSMNLDMSQPAVMEILNKLVTPKPKKAK